MKLLYISSAPEDLRFINKFSTVFSEITCVHTTLFSYLFQRVLDHTVSKHHLCFALPFNMNSDKCDKRLAEFNTKARLLNDNEICRNYSGFKQKLEYLIKHYRYDLVMIPSGRMLSQKVLDQVAKENNLPTLFIGYGNFPRKTFLDNVGTDYSSSLVCQAMPEIENINPEHWAENFLDNKLNSPVPPQAKNIFKTKFSRILRYFLCKIERAIFLAHDTNYKFTNVIKFVFNGTKLDDTTEADLGSSKYIFYPCQLSSDAQLLLNSDIGNVEAIKIASKQAELDGLKLIVKMHPAETDNRALAQIYALRESLNFIISNQNTYDILRNCSSVITINSTLGIEAKAIGKKVSVLGRAVYANWNMKQAINYFENTLFDVDYFSDEKIDMGEWEKIKSRFKI